MKRMLSFLLLILFYSVHAQTGGKIAYYYKGKLISFPVNNSRLVIRLAAGQTAAQLKARLSSMAKIADTAIRPLGNAKLIVVNIGNSSNPFKTISLLRTQAHADFVHPCFASSSGKDMGYGDELVVKLKPSTSSATFNNLVIKNHCSIIKKYAFADGIYILSAGAFNQYDAIAVANRFFETGFFAYAAPDLTLLDGFLSDPNDPLYAYQWEHKNTGSPIQYNGLPGADMNVQQAWAISTGAGIKVAVLDEGVDTGHADLKANLLQGYDCISGTANPGDGRPLSPARAHGTNCTGIIAAVANNNIGIAGIAPDSKIIPINLAAANGSFTSESNIAGGFDYAWQHGADVISNSWGGGSPSDIIDDAISRAVTLGRGGKGTVVLFASGNNNAGIGYPASNPNVISVGGVNMCGQRKSPSSCDGEGWGASYGTGLDVVAPCVKIISTDISGSGGYNTAAGAAGDYFFTFNGTSSATPGAAGVVALILSANNNLTATQVRSVLENTCDKLPGYSYGLAADQPNGTWNNETGHGRVNAFNAVQTALSGIYCSVQVKAAGPTRFCPGGSVNLSVVNPVAGTSYQWRKDGVNFSTGISVIAVADGSYDVVALASNGCIAVAAPVVVTVLSNPSPLTVNAGIDTFICAGNSVKLGNYATGGAPFLQDKRVFGMDWQSNSFVKFSLQDPLHFDTIARNMVSNADYAAGDFFSGGDFTPYGYYAITEGTGKLFKVDTATGAQQFVGMAVAPAGYYWSGLAWDLTTRSLFGLASAASGSRLCSIDPFTAAVTIVAVVPVGSTEWLAIDNNGSMYTMSDNNYIYRIDKITGAATPLPSSVGADVIYEQDADFDPLNNTLYLTSIIKYQNYVSDLRTADTISGKTAVVGSLGGLSEIDASAIAGPGYLYNWSPAAGLNTTTASLPVATPLTTTTYTLNVTDMCGNTASSQVTIKVSSPPAAVISAATDSICAGETVTLHTAPGSGYAYQWYLNGNSISGATDSVYTAADGGIYKVRIINGACDSVSAPYLVKTCELRLNDNTAASTCAAYLYDSGGPLNNYGDGESFTKTIAAAKAGSFPRLTIRSFNTEPANDVLTIYDGPDTLSPVLAAVSGTPAVPLTYTGISGALTLRFVSNAAVNAPGWSGTIACHQPAVYRSKTSGNADIATTWEVKSGSSFIDASDIPHVYDDSIIIQPGHTVTINTAAQLDQIWVKAGGTLRVAAPLTLNDDAGVDLLVDGSLLVETAGNIQGNGAIILNGSLDNSASVSSNIFVGIDIIGNGSQTIAAGGNFSNVTIHNPSVTFNLFNDVFIDSLMLDNGTGITAVNTTNTAWILTVNKQLNLQNGRLVLNNGNVMNLPAGCAVAGASAASFIEGAVINSANTAGLSTLVFPIGKNNIYRPLTLSVTHLSAGISSYKAEVFNTEPGKSKLPVGINAVSNRRYFNITNMGSQPVSDAAVRLTYGSDDAVTDSASLRIAKDDGLGNWINIGGAGIGNGAGSITSAVNFTAFGDFALANTSTGSNAFAVRWIATDAKAIGRQVNIGWAIGNEINIKNYTVERSADGVSFVEIAKLNASSVIAVEKEYEYLDLLPLNGTNYYRIRQTDLEGSYNYSKTVQATITGVTDFVLWPNPASTTVAIQNSQTMFRLQCYNSNGQLIYDVRPYASFYSIPVRQWAAGVYQVKITGAGGVMQTRFVKE